MLDINSASQIDAALELYEAALSKDGDDHPRTMKFRATYSTRVCVSEHDRQWRRNNCAEFDANAVPILTIRYVGVWDTVGALGWPNIIPGAKWLNRKRGFHDVRLTSKVQAARHALALDERRKPFRPTIWNNVAELNADRGASHYHPDAPYQQKWFPGVHGAVGGWWSKPSVIRRRSVVDSRWSEACRLGGKHNFVIAHLRDGARSFRSSSKRTRSPVARSRCNRILEAFTHGRRPRRSA